MNLIVKKIKNDVNDIDAIALGGSYGRNEGIWVISEDGNEILPYNDYDITVITDSIVNPEVISNVRVTLAKKIGIKWIDIDILSNRDLRRLKSHQMNVDLIRGNKILYGDKDIFNKCRKMNFSKLPYRDIEKQYFTRLWTFFGSFGETISDLDMEQATFFCNQMCKAIFACIDVLLISRHQYVTGYEERTKKILKIYPDDKQLGFYTRWALEKRKTPVEKFMKASDALSLYNDIYSLYSLSMMKAMKWRWKILNNCNFASFYYYLSIYHMSRIILNKFIRKSDGYQKYMDICLAQNLIFHAYNMGKIKNCLLRKAAELLRKNGYSVIGDADWNCMRLLVAKARNKL